MSNSSKLFLFWEFNYSYMFNQEKWKTEMLSNNSMHLFK